jgi:hypothetical protein
VRLHTNARAKPSAIARTAIVAAQCSFRPGAAGARHPLKIEATTGDELPKPECRPMAQLTLRRASRSIGFRRVETDKSKCLARNSNRVPVHYLNLARIRGEAFAIEETKGKTKVRRPIIASFPYSLSR